jgi:tetratricopeptide (TPR) repeat protein
MKKLLTLSLSLIIGLAAYAQPANVTKAEKLKDKGEFVEAASLIDAATENEKTKDKGKTWYTRGLVYEEMAVKSPNTNPNALEVAVDSYKKAMSMEKENSSIYFLSNQRVETIWGSALNKAIELYQAEDFKGAGAQFDIAIMTKPQDTTALLYGAVVAQEDSDWERSKMLYYKLLNNTVYESPSLFQSLVWIERNQSKDYDQAIKVLKMAQEKYPADKSFVNEEINILIVTERVDEARASLQAAIDKDPKDPLLYFNLGYLNDQVGDEEGALKSYKSAVEIDADYFDAIFNIAVLYFNKAVAEYKTAGNMDMKEYNKNGRAVEAKGDGYFRDALPYLERSAELKPDELSVLETLNTVYTRLKMNDKAKALTKRIEEIDAMNANK